MLKRWAPNEVQMNGVESKANWCLRARVNEQNDEYARLTVGTQAKTNDKCDSCVRYFKVDAMFDGEPVEVLEKTM